MGAIIDTIGICPPDFFCGREDELDILITSISAAGSSGHVALIEGITGSGKSSLLNKVTSELNESMSAEKKWLALGNEFCETSGTVYSVFVKLLTDIKSHGRHGWLVKIVGKESIQSAIDVALGLIENIAGASELPFAKPIADGTTGTVRNLMDPLNPYQAANYNRLLASYLNVLQEIGAELAKKDGRIALLFDNVHWCTGPDFVLLMDLIRKLPGIPGITFVLAYEKGGNPNEEYGKLLKEILMHGETRIILEKLHSKEITEFAERRYSIPIDDGVARFLENNIGDPRCLVLCFNLLLQKRLAPDEAGFTTVLAQAIAGPGEAFFYGHGDLWNQASRLCILDSPFPVNIIGCMIGEPQLTPAQLKFQLQGSLLLRNVNNDWYDFDAPFVKKYCQNQLQDAEKIQLHREAAACIASKIDLFPDQQKADLLLARHYSQARKYREALDLDLKIIDRYYWNINYPIALALVEDAVTCAGKIQDLDALARAYLKKGDICRVSYRYKDAAHAYEKCLALSRQLSPGSDKGWYYEALALSQLGVVDQLTDNVPEAMQHFDASRQIFEKNSDQNGVTLNLDRIGVLFQLQNKLPRAEDTFRDSLEKKQALGTDRFGEACTLANLGVVHELRGAYTDAEDSYQASLTIVDELRNVIQGESSFEHQELDHLDAEVHRRWGNLLRRQREFTDSQIHYESSLSIDRQIGNRSGEATTLRELGILYRLKGGGPACMAEAMACLRASLEIEEDIGNSQGRDATLREIEIVNGRGS